MPAINPQRLKELLIKDLLTPFAMKRRLSYAQLNDLVRRAMADKVFDLSASDDEFANPFWMRSKQRIGWRTSNVQEERLICSRPMGLTRSSRRRRMAATPRRNCKNFLPRSASPLQIGWKMTVRSTHKTAHAGPTTTRGSPPGAAEAEGSRSEGEGQRGSGLQLRAT